LISAFAQMIIVSRRSFHQAAAASCHTFVPIVVLQMTKESWERNSRDPRGRVASLSDADFKILYEYLIANFNPSRPLPKLPRTLEYLDRLLIGGVQYRICDIALRLYCSC
jgi:hypothetical protein